MPQFCKIRFDLAHDVSAECAGALAFDVPDPHLRTMADSPAHAPAPALTLDITGMHCSGCAGVVEKALERLAGAGTVTVNMALERADIRAGVDPAAAVAAVEAAGYGASARVGTPQERQLARERLEADRRADERRTFLLFVVSALLFLPFLADMAAAMLGYGHGALLSPFVQLALAAPVQFICGWRFIRGAFKSLRVGAPNMDVLVVLGTLAAFGLSAWRVIAGHAAHGHALYFEGSVAIITFVLLGKVLEAWARSDTGDALSALSREQAATVMVFRDKAWSDVPATSLKAGEYFAVRPGQRAVADGVVTQGTSEMDESLVTGESQRLLKTPGTKVISGALNGASMLTVEATAVGEDATLARIARLVETAQTSRAPAQKLADSVARIFVPAVLLIAVVTYGVWFWLGDSEMALIAAISVLVVSCPCALGLATPIALVAGMGSAAKAGILVRDVEALEQAAGIDTIAFDKTGTLTEGKPRVAAISAPGVGPNDALKLALALSLGSEHALASAIRDAAQDRDVTAEPAEQLEVVPGGGVKGMINGVPALFGSAEFVRAAGISLGVLEQVISRDPGFGEAQTVSWLAGAGRVIGAFAFVDGVRPYAEQVVKALTTEGLHVVMLSGDRQGAAAAVGKTLGIADVRAGLKPAGKVQALKALAAEGRRLAMVGDGLNDAPALAAAPLGIAMGTGTDAARAAAGITLMRADLRLVPKALHAARETRAVIRQNLWLAFLFNGIGIPLAALGWLTPAIAGAAMAASSVSVALNAMRLARRKLG
jgi:P-type Cu+ transporter